MFELVCCFERGTCFRVNNVINWKRLKTAKVQWIFIKHSIGEGQAFSLAHKLNKRVKRLSFFTIGLDWTKLEFVSILLRKFLPSLRVSLCVYLPGPDHCDIERHLFSFDKCCESLQDFYQTLQWSMIINADLGELEVNANLFAHGNSLVQFFQIESFESLIENFLVTL